VPVREPAGCAGGSAPACRAGHTSRSWRAWLTAMPYELSRSTNGVPAPSTSPSESAQPAMNDESYELAVGLQQPW